MDCSSVSNLKRYYVYSIKSIYLSPKANCTLRKEKKYIFRIWFNFFLLTCESNDNEWNKNLKQIFCRIIENKMDFLSKNNINKLILEFKTFNESVLNIYHCELLYDEMFYESLC